MTFLFPLFLTALAALAVPILLHLMRRREGKTVVFPALRYLSRTTREHARIIRLRQILLLALRVAAVLLLVLAGARLVLPLGGTDDPPAGLALVVDNGLTSGAVIGDGRVLDSLVVRAEAVLARTGSRDRIWVVPAGEPWRPALPMSPEEARATLDGLSSSHVTANLETALRRARSLLEAAALDAAEIVLLSDLRAESLPDPIPEASPFQIPVRIAPPPPTPTSNRGVAQIEVSGGLIPRAGDPGELQLRLAGTARADATVRIYLEGELLSAARTDSAGVAVVPIPPLAEGWAHGRVEAPPDDLRADDVGYFVFPVLPPPPVHLEASISPFVRDAAEVLEDAGRLRIVDGASASVHLLSGTDPSGLPDSGDIVLVPPDDPALLPALNRVLGELLPGWRLEATPADTPGTRVLDGGSMREILPGRLEVRAAYRMARDESGPDPERLLTLSDGSDWLVATHGENRTVLLFASPLTPAASDLPTSAAMLPLVDRLTTPTGMSPEGTELLAGAPLPLPSDAHTLELPEGTRRAAEGTSVFVETGRAGIIRVLGPGEEVLRLHAVNPRPPSSTTSMQPEDVVDRLSPTWARATVEDPWPGAVLADRRGREVWRPLLAGLLLVLIAEGWLAASGGGRRDQADTSGEQAEESGHTRAANPSAR